MLNKANKSLLKFNSTKTFDKKFTNIYIVKELPLIVHGVHLLEIRLLYLLCGFLH